MVDLLDSLAGNREIGGIRPSGEVGVSAAVDGNSNRIFDIAEIFAASAQIGGVQQPGAGGVQLGHKRVVGCRQCVVGGLKRTRRDREIRIVGVARNIRVAGGVDIDGCALVLAVRVPVIRVCAPQVGGIEQAAAGGVQFGDKRRRAVRGG